MPPKVIPMIRRKDLASTKALVEFIRKNCPPGPFKPCAYYHAELDMVVVCLKDTSYSIVETSRFGGVMYENHRPVKEIVGFEIYGVRGFVEKTGLAFKGRWVVKDLVRKIAREETPLDPHLYGIFAGACFQIEHILQKESLSFSV